HPVLDGCRTSSACHDRFTKETPTSLVPALTGRRTSRPSSAWLPYSSHSGFHESVPAKLAGGGTTRSPPIVNVLTRWRSIRNSSWWGSASPRTALYSVFWSLTVNRYSPSTGKVWAIDAPPRDPNGSFSLVRSSCSSRAGTA